MRATVMHSAGDVRVEDVRDAAIEEPTDAVLRVVRACICGSDLHGYHSMSTDQPTRPMGHEMIGIVEDIGDAVTTLRKGDFVIAPFMYSDNSCVFCREGFHTSCIHGGFYGNQAVGGMQAEAQRIPLADGSLVKLPGVTENDTELFASLLTLSDVYLTGYHAAYMADVTPGKTVTVIGDGAVGLSAVLASHRMGASRIILMGRHTSRTDLGIDFGATDIVPERDAAGTARVRELTNGEGSEVVIDAVGLLPAYHQAVEVARTGGVISRVGLPQYAEAPVGFDSLFRKNITLTGGIAPVRAYLEGAIPQVLSGELNPGRVFDRVLSLEEAPLGYAAMDSREALKVMLTR